MTEPFFDSVLESVLFVFPVFLLSFVSFLAFAFEVDFFVSAFVSTFFSAVFFTVFFTFEFGAANKEADIVSPMQKNNVFFI